MTNTATTPRLQRPKKPLTVDDKERLLNILARMVGLCGCRGWPFVEVLTDDDERRSFPLTDEGAAVVGYARRLLAEFGKQPIPLDQKR